MRISTLDWTSLVLVIIGGLNWLLVGLFGFDLVAAIFGELSGEVSIVSRIIYILIGLAAVYLIFFATRLSRRTGRT